MLLDMTNSSLQSLSMQMSLSAMHVLPLMHAIATKTTLTHLSFIPRPDNPNLPITFPDPAAPLSGLEAFCRGWPVLTTLQSLRRFEHPRLSPDACSITASAWLQLRHLESFTLDWPRGNRAAVELFTHVANCLDSLTALRVLGLDEHDPSLEHDEALLLFHTLRSSTVLPVTLHSLSLHGVTFPQLGDGSSLCAAISRMHAVRTLMITAPQMESSVSGDLDLELYTGSFRPWQLSRHLLPLKGLRCLRLEIPGRVAIPIAQVRLFA